MTYKGSSTGVIFGVLKEIAYLMKEFNTKYIVFCWDSKPNIRNTIYKDYKANRHTEVLDEEALAFEKEFYNQVHKLETEYLRTIGFRNIFKQPGYESDDIMASLCLNLPKGDEAILVTGDQDLFQMLTNSVCQYNPITKQIITSHAFREHFLIDPTQWVMVKAIAGCSTDNVKGVTGVGEKTAIKYLKGELKKELKAYLNIEAAKEDELIERNLQLVRLPYKNTAVFQLKKDKLSVEGWRKVINSLGMKSLKDSFPFRK
jgi:DNA polymerase-1